MQTERDPRINAIPDIHGHAKGEHKPYTEERPLPLTARMLFLWFYHACRRGFPRFLMVADHMNYLTFEDPAAVNLVRRALKLAQAGDLYGAAETANVDVAHAQIVSEGLRRGMRYSIGAEVDNDPRARPDAQNIVDAMRPDGLIRSIHFLPIDHPVHGPNWNWPFDNPEFSSLYDHVGTEKTWEIYMTVLLDAIERLSGNIVGHFYVPAKFGHWPDDATLEKYEDQFIDAIAARGMAVEFNTRFLYGDHTDEEKARYLDANRRLLRKAQAKGVGIAVGSDAHSPRDQGNGFATVLAVLDELEINEIVFPIGGRLARVALRFVKPPEPVAPPPPPPPEPVVAVRAPHVAEPDADTAEPAVKAPRKRTTTKSVAASDAPVEGDVPALAAEPADAVTKPKKAAKATTSAEPALSVLPEDVSVPEPAIGVADVPAVVAAAPAAKPIPAAKTAPAAKPPKAVAEKPAPVIKAPAKLAAKKAAPVKAAPVPAKAAVATKPTKPAPKTKPAAAVKTVAKPAVKAAVKAAPAKKAPTKAPAKPVAKKAPAKKTPPPKKAAAKKSPVRAAPAKKTVVKKTVTKKTAARPVAKHAPAKKAPARKPVAKKMPAKKAAAKRR